MPMLQANRSPTEKPLMSRIQHKAVIKGLKKEQYVEAMLKYLCIHRMDPELLKEILLIEDALDDLFCDRKFGYIAEWIYRQWRNQLEPDEKPIQPSKVHIFPYVGQNVVKAFRFKKKSVSLHQSHFKKLMQKKIKKCPEEYEQEKEIENTVNDIIPSFPCNQDAPHRRGIKRKLTIEVY